MRKGSDIPWSEYLQKAIDNAKMSPADLSKRSGVNESQISRWLRGIGQPSPENLRKIQPVLRVPLLGLLVAAGHITQEEARLRDLPAPSPPLARGVSTEGLNEEQERDLRRYAEFLRSQNPGAKA